MFFAYSVVTLLIFHQVVKEIILPAERGAGMQITGAFFRRDSQVFLDLVFFNQTPSPLSGFAIQFNKNSYVLYSPFLILRYRAQVWIGASATVFVVGNARPERGSFVARQHSPQHA